MPALVSSPERSGAASGCRAVGQELNKAEAERRYGGAAKLARGRSSFNGNHLEAAVRMFGGNGVEDGEAVALIQPDAVRRVGVDRV